MQKIILLTGSAQTDAQMLFDLVNYKIPNLGPVYESVVVQDFGKRNKEVISELYNLGTNIILEMWPEGDNSKYYSIFGIKHPAKISSYLSDKIKLADKQECHLFITTYSSDVLNALRVMVHRKTISHEQLFILYYDSEVLTKINCDKNGRLNLWPYGFFDQMVHDLSKLLRPSK